MFPIYLEEIANYISRLFRAGASMKAAFEFIIRILITYPLHVSVSKAPVPPVRTMVHSCVWTVIPRGIIDNKNRLRPNVFGD